MSLLFDALKHAQQSNADNVSNVKQELAIDSMDPVASQTADESLNTSVGQSTAQSEPIANKGTSSAKQNIAGARAAQAIFSATTQPKRNRLILLILLLSAVLISFVGTWFYLQTPEDETIKVHTPPVMPPRANTTPTNIPKQSTASATAIDTHNPTTNKEVGKKTPAPITKNSSTAHVATNIIEAHPIVSKNKHYAKQTNINDDVSTTPTPSTISMASVTPPKQKAAKKINTVNAPIALTASTNSDPLKEAYAALTEGKLDDAEGQYLAVLAKRPHEKDALLGLAIIAHRKSQTSRALDLYQQVLREDPENSNATAGLLSLSAATDPVAAEGHLKQALELKQTSPELHYALGNLLARQKRWSEAQQAFFRAANLAPDHALYTYNLAVALDHLGKSSAAISSYERVIQLSKPTDSTINRSAIRQRVQELRKYLLTNPGNSTGSP